MMIRILSRISFLLMTLAISACGTMLVPEEIAPRGPDRVATRVALYNVNHGPCDLPGQLDRSVLSADSAARPAGGEVIAGFRNFLIRGADPFPCNRQRSQEYTGAFHFNLDDLRGTIVDRAVVKLVRRNTSIPWSPPILSRLCMVAVSRATEDWVAGYAAGPAGTTIAALPFTRGRGNRITGGIAFDSGVTGVAFEFDVTDMAQRWITGPHNFGLIVHQEGETGAYVGADDLSCTSIFTAQIELSIRRFVPISP